MKRLFLPTFLLAAFVFGLAGCASMGGPSEEAAAETVALTDIPAPARATIEKNTAGGTIRSIEKEESDGKVIYDVEATVGDKKVEYDVAEDGTVLSSEESVPYATLPPSVQAAAEDYFGSAEGLEASKELEEGKTFYEVAGKKDGKTRELKLSDTGEILEEE
jgi:uncharacterized membrane protein YkoI